MAPDDGVGAGQTVRVRVAANPLVGVAEEEALTLPVGSTIADALAGSDLLRRHPPLQGDGMKTGIWGALRPRDTVLQDGDRVEIYRPLVNDPKEARRSRARTERRAKRALRHLICSRRRPRPERAATRRPGPGRRGTRAPRWR